MNERMSAARPRSLACMHTHPHTTLELNTGWTVQTAGDPLLSPEPVRNRVIPATVPGCVTTDLLDAGLIEDPYLNDNELKIDWIGRTDWRYRCVFEVGTAMLAQQRVDLVFDGLDTIATLALNGLPLGEANNMHRCWRFDAKPLLQPGRNELLVEFAAPVTYAEATRRRDYHLLLQRKDTTERLDHLHNFIRKMACNYGWDWGPTLPTSGIWRDVRLEAWSHARIGDVRPQTTLHADDSASLVLRVETEPESEPKPLALRYRVIDPDNGTIAGGTFEGVTGGDIATACVAIEKPKLWWPRGYGKQPLYVVEIDLLDEQSRVLQTRRQRIGLRSVELVTDPDDVPVPHLGQGETMTLKVNGKPIYCKGANWIPDDCFPSRLTPQRYRRRIQQAVDANMNMLRVWGGGIFESDAMFYDVCDELGVMVWQDFLFACSLYPESEPYRSNIEAEVRDNVSRLARHPCIVLWNGANECIWITYGYGNEWHTVRPPGDGTWGLGYYLDLLPRLVREVDPSRPYWPNSPYSGSMDRHPNANEFGNRHMWDVWHGEGNYRNYLGHYPRMATEFGYHSPACWPTIEWFCPPEQRYWDSPILSLHNKNGRPGQQMTHERLHDDFNPPTDNFNDWHYLAQIVQARALSMGIEWFRCLFPWNQAALYWQLNDCYPVSSWSAIDSTGRRKPLWYASRRFFAPRLLSIKPTRPVSSGAAADALAVYLHNDDDHPWAAAVTATRRTLDGRVVDSLTRSLVVTPRTLKRFDVPGDWLDRPEQTFLTAETDGSAYAFWWFAPDKRLAYPEPDFEADLAQTNTGYRLTLIARTMLRDLCVFPDRLDPDATISDQCLTLLPGDHIGLDITTQKRMSLAGLTTRPVLNCANHFGLTGG